jgi:hypothetical protein
LLGSQLQTISLRGWTKYGARGFALFHIKKSEADYQVVVFHFTPYPCFKSHLDLADDNFWCTSRWCLVISSAQRSWKNRFRSHPVPQTLAMVVTINARTSRNARLAHVVHCYWLASYLLWVFCDAIACFVIAVLTMGSCQRWQCWHGDSGNSGNVVTVVTVVTVVAVTVMAVTWWQCWQWWQWWQW